MEGVGPRAAPDGPLGTDVPLVVDETGDTITGSLVMEADLFIATGRNVVFGGGALGGNPDLAYNGRAVCIADAAISGCGTGDITGVAAGTGLLGGGTFGEVALRVDTDFIQRRVLGACTAGSAVRSVSADGSVVCEDDDVGVTRVDTGAGLAGGPVTVTGTLSIATGGVTSAMLLDSTIAGIDLGDAIVTAAKLAADAVTSAKILDGTIATLDLADGAITSAKLADGAVTSLKIADGTIVPADLSFAAGDITGVSVTAGSGLTGGAASGEATLGVDAAVLQKRVSSSCAAGSSIRAIAQEGTVTCETDDDAGGDITAVTVTTGSGLTGGGTTGALNLAVDTAVLQKRVSGSCVSGEAVRVVNSDGTVACQDVNNGRAASAASTTVKTIASSCTSYQSSQITVPGAGTILASAAVRIQLSHTSGSADAMRVGFGTSTTDCPGGGNAAGVRLPSGMGTASDYEYTLNPMRMFTVSASGTYTYYLNGIMESGASSGDLIWSASEHLLFVPS